MKHAIARVKFQNVTVRSKPNIPLRMRRARYNVIYVLVKMNERAPLRTGSTRTGDTRIIHMNRVLNTTEKDEIRFLFNLLYGKTTPS